MTPPASLPNAKKALDPASVGDVLAAFSSRNSSEEVAEDPLLIIDEDAAQNASAPPVRREEYRNLFSRLRSG
jgi:hypothetical protein